MSKVYATYGIVYYTLGDYQVKQSLLFPTSKACAEHCIKQIEEVV